MKFSRGVGSLCHTLGNSGGMGSHQFLIKNMENSRRWEGVLNRIPSVVVELIFLEPHNLDLDIHKEMHPSFAL